MQALRLREDQRWAPNHHWVVDWPPCVQRNLVLMPSPYQPKLSSLETAPDLAAVNWQWPWELSICRVHLFRVCQKGAVKCVPTCPRMLMKSTFLHVPPQRNQRCWSPGSFRGGSPWIQCRESGSCMLLASGWSEPAGISFASDLSGRYSSCGRSRSLGSYTWREWWKMLGAFDDRYSMISPESMQFLARTSGHSKLGNSFQSYRKVCRCHPWNFLAADNQCRQQAENYLAQLYFPRRQKRQRNLDHLCWKLLFGIALKQERLKKNKTQ